MLADGHLLDTLAAVDICTIFGNALENATEAVAKLPPEKREITLKVARLGQNLVIRFENPFPGGTTFDADCPATTKENAALHGYGLRSIGQTAKKYGGNLSIDTQAEQFSLNVRIPLAAQ